MLRRLPLPVAVLVLALLTAAVHAGLLAWDTRRDVDPATGASSGPYEGWQVVAVVVLLLALGLAAAWRGPWWLVLVVPVVFTVVWSVSAATAPDGDGLWPVGAMLVAVAGGVGAAGCHVVAGVLGHRQQTAE